MISGQQDFYREIVEPIGHRAKERKEEFESEKKKLINQLTRNVGNEFMDEDGNLLWNEIVRYNSGNL